MKVCAKCGEEKPFTEFHKDSTKTDGFVGSCRVCKKKYRATYYKDNAERLKEYSLKYAKENAEESRERNKRWRENNRDYHLERRREYFAYKYHSDPEYACNYKMRAMLARALKAIGSEKSSSTFDSLGYSAKDLALRLSVNFKPGMSWSNFGEWEIDHLIPMSRMIARGERRPHIVNALCNLAPKWREENRKKGNRYVG